MPSYTTLLQTPLDALSPEDAGFIEALLDVMRLFRPFSEAMDAFIAARGYAGDLSDVNAKVAYIRGVFERAGMTPPREVRAWYADGQPIKRDTAFQICFAFGLDGTETDAFFRQTYARERSFDCHQMQEAVYYFCLNNGLSYAQARAIIARVPPPKAGKPNGTGVYTDFILQTINRMATEEALISWLRENSHLFTANSATATKTIRLLWAEAAGEDGLLLRENRRFVAASDDTANGRYGKLRAFSDGLKPWDAYLAILQLDKKRVSRLETDRSIKPILSQLHAAARDSFPDRQGIDRILRGERVSYERVRKWLILLLFYTFWAKKALSSGSYVAEAPDSCRCIDFMNQALLEAGYSELYVGNPYDWIFLYAAKDQEPLPIFREIWNALLGVALD